jgi:hypothetical protein
VFFALGMSCILGICDLESYKISSVPQNFADTRIRVKGRFVKKDEMALYSEAVGHDEIDDDGDNQQTAPPDITTGNDDDNTDRSSLKPDVSVSTILPNSSDSIDELAAPVKIDG